MFVPVKPSHQKRVRVRMHNNLIRQLIRWCCRCCCPHSLHMLLLNILGLTKTLHRKVVKKNQVSAQRDVRRLSFTVPAAQFPRDGNIDVLVYKCTPSRRGPRTCALRRRQVPGRVRMARAPKRSTSELYLKIIWGMSHI